MSKRKDCPPVIRPEPGPPCPTNCICQYYKKNIEEIESQLKATLTHECPHQEAREKKGEEGQGVSPCTEECPCDGKCIEGAMFPMFCDCDDPSTPPCPDSGANPDQN